MALTPVQNLYNAFLALIESDEWDTWEDVSVETDLRQIALSAIPWFKFPRCSLEFDEAGEYFVDENITNTEIQILALFMRFNWLGRVIDTWENLKPMYSERDFSPAKQMSEFRGRQEDALNQAEKLEQIYYRSIKGKPYDYSKLAGGKGKS